MSCTPNGPVIYSESPWIGAANPLIYKVNSCKWPVNTFDDVDSFHTVLNNSGFAQLHISSTYQTFVALDKITVSGTRYSGVYKIISVEGPEQITIDAPFTLADSGTVQRYYDNYRVEVRVTTGRQVPMVVNTMEVRGTVVGIPDANGDAIIDVSDIVRAQLGKAENRLCASLSDNSNEIATNDTNMWTSFYIEVREIWASSNGTSVEDFESAWVRDDDEGGDINYYFCVFGGHQVNDPDGRSFGRYDIGQVDAGEPKAQFLTSFTNPRYFLGEEFDLQIISSIGDNTGLGLEYVIREYDEQGELATTQTTEALPNSYEGVYRFAFSEHTFHANTKNFDFFIQKTGLVLSETINVTVDRSNCQAHFPRLYLRWLNSLGGWDAWYFRARKVFQTDVTRTTAQTNIYGDWDSDFISTRGPRFVSRVDAKRVVVATTQYLSETEQEEFVSLFESPAVESQIEDTTGDCNNMIHKRIILLDSSYEYRNNIKKPREISIRFEESALRIIPTQ